MKTTISTKEPHNNIINNKSYSLEKIKIFLKELHLKFFMSKKNKSFTEKLDEYFIWDNKTIGHFFLGAGLVLFILNVSSILNFIQYANIGFPMEGFYASTLSSLFLMGYSLYNIYS